MDDRTHYQLWVTSLGDDVPWIRNNYHAGDYELAEERYQLYCANPAVRVVKMTLTLYHHNGDTETVLIRRHDKE